MSFSFHKYLCYSVNCWDFDSIPSSSEVWNSFQDSSTRFTILCYHFEGVFLIGYLELNLLNPLTEGTGTKQFGILQSIQPSQYLQFKEAFFSHSSKSRPVISLQNGIRGSVAAFSPSPFIWSFSNKRIVRALERWRILLGLYLFN